MRSAVIIMAGVAVGILIAATLGHRQHYGGAGNAISYGHRWLEFCEARRAKMAAEGLPMNSPVTRSSLEHANNLAREILRVQSQMQSR